MPIWKDQEPIYKIRCNGKGGEREFLFESPEEDSNPDYGHQLVFLLREKDLSSPHVFQLTLVPEGEESYRIDWIGYTQESEIRGAGIPEVLLPFIARKLAKYIRSSAKERRSDDARQFSCPGFGTIETGIQESRNGFATNMWKRLEGKGLAVHCESEDRYRTIAPDSQLNSLHPSS